jgi:malonyl-CoA O-methyltransferase
LRVLPPAEAFARWASTYVDTPLAVLEDAAAGTLTPPLAGKAVLDAGCGTGHRVARLSQLGAAGRLVGVDLVPTMLSRNADQEAGGRPSLVAGDVRALPLADQLFDVVWCRLVLGYVPALDPAYGELARVARPGAVLMVTDLHPDAGRRGHQRTFRDRFGTLHAVEYCVHEAGEHERAARAAGYVLDRCIALTAGPAIRHFYERAGLLDLYREHCGLPLVLALRFVRPHGAARARA